MKKCITQKCGLGRNKMEQEIVETVNKLLNDENITFMQIKFKVGLENCEVDAKGNRLGYLLLETLGVTEDEVKDLIEKIVRPATTQFNKELTELIEKRLKGLGK